MKYLTLTTESRVQLLDAYSCICSSLKEAEELAGENGFIATMPDILLMKYKVDFQGVTDHPCPDHFSILGYGHVTKGIDTEGVLFDKGTHIIATVHGKGLIDSKTIDDIKESDLIDDEKDFNGGMSWVKRSYLNGSLKHSEEEFNTLLQGKTLSHTNLPVYTNEDLLNREVCESEFIVVTPSEGYFFAANNLDSDMGAYFNTCYFENRADLQSDYEGYAHKEPIEDFKLKIQLNEKFLGIVGNKKMRNKYVKKFQISASFPFNFHTEQTQSRILHASFYLRDISFSLHGLKNSLNSRYLVVPDEKVVKYLLAMKFQEFNFDEITNTLSNKVNNYIKQTSWRTKKITQEGLYEIIKNSFDKELESYRKKYVAHL